MAIRLSRVEKRARMAGYSWQPNSSHQGPFNSSRRQDLGEIPPNSDRCGRWAWLANVRDRSSPCTFYCLVESVSLIELFWVKETGPSCSCFAPYLHPSPPQMHHAMAAEGRPPGLTPTFHPLPTGRVLRGWKWEGEGGGVRGALV